MTAESSSYTSSNKAFFDTHAQAYDARSTSIKLAKIFAKAILASESDDFEFDDEETRVLDFACGTGHISRELAGDVKYVVGMDISQGMVDQYNLRVENQGIDKEEMQAFCVDLLDQRLGYDGVSRVIGEGRREFDVIVCCLGYHHFPDIQLVTRRLCEFLRVGGKLFVGDFQAIALLATSADAKEDLVEPGTLEDYSDTVPHLRGFTQEKIEGVFTKAGLGDLTFDIVVETAMLHKQSVRVFLASGVKT